MKVGEFCTAYPTFVEASEEGEREEDSDSSFVLLVSGLEFGSSLLAAGGEEGGGIGVDDVMSLELSAQMLADFVSGRLGGEQQVQLASRIGR